MAAMYTKMTAAGSSLIVAPRTISKELEAKISIAIGAFIVEHGIGKLATKQVRQYVEKEVRVSLANHKEALKRIMLQEFRKSKTEKAAKRSIPQPWKIKTRCQTITKGLQFVFAQLRDQPELASKVALRDMLELSDLQGVENAEVSRLAATHLRMLCVTWLKQAAVPDWPEGRVPTADEVVQFLISVYAVERTGLSYPHRTDLLEFLDRTPPVHSATDYYGWDPASSPPPASDAKSAFSSMTDTVLKSWFAHSLNVSLGCSFPQLLQHLPTFYPYKSHTDLTPQEYRDQIHMISTVVLVLTDFGKLKCEPELLAHEYSFLRQHLVLQIVRQDIPLLSEMLRALRCFVGADNLISVRRGMALIMLSQSSDGSWKTVRDASPQDLFHSTIRSLHTLGEMRIHGYAPSIPSVLQLLELNLNAELPAKMLESDRHKDTSVGSATKSSTASDGPAPAESSSVSPPSSGTSSSQHVTAEESLEQQVRFHQSMLEKAGDNMKNVSAALAMQVLTTLSNVKLSVDILKSTGVGRTINKLRKHSNEEVAKTATLLVAKWKKDLL